MQRLVTVGQLFTQAIVGSAQFLRRQFQATRSQLQIALVLGITLAHAFKQAAQSAQQLPQGRVGRFRTPGSGFKQRGQRSLIGDADGPLELAQQCFLHDV